MATVKKKNELNTPERIEAALIPDGEQPLSTPSNWEWVTLSSISTVISKGTTPQGGKNAYLSDGVNFLRVENICDDGTISHDNIMHVSKEMHEGFLKRSILQENDLLISIAGTLGKTCIVRRIDLPLNTNQAVSFSRLKEYINCKYIKLSIDNPEIQKHLLSQTKVTSIPNLTLEIIGNCPIPLAPFTEQQRIVDRIESLFTKLDEAKEKAQAVVDGFEDRKAAILHKAFTGGLTEKWRRTHMHSSKEWNSIPFEECIDTMQNGIAKRKGTEGEPFVVIRLANLSDESFIEDDLREIRLDEKEQHNYELHQDDAIMIRVNGSKENVGKQYRVTNQKKWAFCDHLIRIHYTANVVSQYIVYYSKTKQYRQYIMDNMVSSAGQNTISRKGLSRLKLPIPSIEEQKEIVSLLDTHYEKENQAIDAAKKVIDQIDTMKKSILARAFRGELGTNDPNDESAMELLKRILE